MLRSTDWIDRLSLALLHRDVSGPRVGQIVTDLETYLETSGADPWNEFGAPGAYADTIAGRTGPTRRTTFALAIFVVVFQVGVLAVLGLIAAGDSASVTVLLPILVAGVLAIAGYTTLFVWLFARHGQVLEGKRRPYPPSRVAVFSAWAAVVVVSAEVLPEVVVFEVSRLVLWFLALTALMYVVVLLMRAGRKRFRLPVDAKEEGIAGRLTGVESIKTGWRIGRDVHQRPR